MKKALKRMAAAALVTLSVLRGGDAFAQNAVDGRVVDANGAPLVGVTVLIKGTQSGTATGANGSYSIKAREDQTLVFSYLGYTTVEEYVGKRTAIDLGIHGLHPDLIKLIGRLKYRTSFGQNALTHSMEVAWLAGLLAGEMGVNVTLARRAGLLHDIGKALDHEIEGSHVQIGVDICRKYKENTQVIHAIEAHHGDVEPKTPLAFIIQACDAISAARPGARRENVESYVKRLENLEEISSSFEGVEQAFAVQAGREVRIMVKPDVISDDQVILLARSIAKKIEDTLDYPGQIKVNVIRESRAVEYAK